MVAAEEAGAIGTVAEHLAVVGKEGKDPEAEVKTMEELSGVRCEKCKARSAAVAVVHQTRRRRAGGRGRGGSGRRASVRTRRARIARCTRT